jgi:hypothetical protein
LQRLVGYITCGYILGGCELFDNKLVIACESELMDRLKSPSTYVRISAEISKERLSISDWKDVLIARSKGKYPTESAVMLKLDLQDLDDSAKEKKIGNQPSPTRFSVFFNYDAQNGFGALVRGQSNCEYLSSKDDITNASKYNVTVDGFSRSQYLVESVKRSQE